VRPVNLMPPEERGQKAPIRTGPIAYLLVGALALGLAAVTMLVLTNNKVSDRKAEISQLKQEEAAASARAAQFAPFASFDSVEQQRSATVKSLADSRFDWERVMRELALVMPSDVWLTELSGSTAAGGAAGTTDPSAATTDTSSIAAPSLHIVGCGAGQESVAGFLSALRDIDGVTRVGLTSSERPTGITGATAATASTDSASGGGDSDCRTRDFIARFEIVAAFDAVPVPPVPGAAPTTPTTPAAAAPAPAAPAPAAGTSPTPAAETAPAPDEGT
jgi:Tfp pilus assembly protein PilN